MIEALRPIDQTQTCPNSIVSEISTLSHQLSDIYSLRDVMPQKYLPNKDWQEIKRLHGIRDQKILDLILISKNKPLDEVEIVLTKHPRENIHPFSLNSVYVYVPSLEKRDEPYLIKTELSDLRRTGVCDNSLEAVNILGDVAIAKENDYSYIYRTKSELLLINKRLDETKTKNPKDKQTIDQLENLSAQLIKDRFIPFKSASHLPTVSLNLCMYEDRFGNPVSESARLILDTKPFEFEIPGQRLLPTIEELGGYDKIITLI